MSYSRKFREEVLKYHEQGNTIQKCHEIFGVGTTTIKEWKRLKKQTGSLEVKQRIYTPTKLDPERLTAYVSENPDKYLREIAEVFNCNESAVRKAFKRLGISRKKN